MRRPGSGTPLERRPPQAGFVLVGFLLLISLVTVFGSTYLRHVLYDMRNSESSRHVSDASDAVDSAVAYAEQRLRRGDFDLSASIDNGPRAALLTATDLGDGHSGLQIQSVDVDGIGVTLLAEVALVPSVNSAGAPDDLPRLDAATVNDLLNDPAVPKLSYNGTQTVTGADLYGLIIIGNSSTLTLDDVTVHGCIVSADVLTAAPFGAYDAPTAPSLIIGGDVRVQAADFLPGVAMVMPDGLVTTSASPASLQCEGDLVAHDLTVNGLGALRGNIATAQPASLDARVMRPGADRGPRAWGAGLDDVQQWEPSFLAFLPRHDAVQDLGTITGFSFP